MATSQLSIEPWSNLRIMQDMTASGLLAKTLDKVKEDKFGQMVQCTKAGGKIIRPTARVDLSTLMVTSMMDSGSMTKLMDSVSTAILMVPSTRATGKKISNTAMV